MASEAKELTMTEKAEAAFRLAAIKVIELARRTGTPVILWEDGRIVARSSDEVTLVPLETEGGDEVPRVENRG